MSVSKAGLVKLNIKASSLGSSSIKTTAATKLATTTRTSVPSFGIMAQRSAVGTGAIFNVKQYNSMSHSMLRHDLNDNRVKVFNNVGGSYYMDLPSSKSSDNKFAAGLMAAATLASIAGSVIDTVKSTDGAGGTIQSDNVLNELSNAKTSGELQGALSKLETAINDCETEIPDLNNKISSEKEIKENTQTKLDDTNSNITSEKQNITKQEGTIQRLSSNITEKETSLKSIETQLSQLSPSDPNYGTLNSQRYSLQAEIKLLEQQKDEAQASLDKSKENLTQLNSDKEKYTKEIADCDKNIEEYNSKKDKLEQQKAEYNKSLHTYQEKYTKLVTSETKELTNLSNEMNKLKEQFNKETKTDKKNSISEKYTSKALEYNKLLHSSDVKGFIEIETNLNNV